MALLGPRQVGKDHPRFGVRHTAIGLSRLFESDADRAKLSDPELYLSQHAGKLVILDEIQRTPELFRTLRGLIDTGRRRGQGTGRFLVLGSASIDLLKQSSETLAGRIRYLELAPLDAGEVGPGRLDALWLRGGFPDSLLADPTPPACGGGWISSAPISSATFRSSGRASRLKRCGGSGRCSPISQGGLLNAASLARSLAVDGKTIASYLDLLVDLLLVRRLAPWHGNMRKRLVKSPKVYVRDGGLVHALLGVGDREALLAHPVAGGSWEGMAIESIIAACPAETEANFFRTSDR